MKDRTFTISISGRHLQGFIIGILFTLFILGGVSGCYQGRKISRITGGAVEIDLPEEVTSYEQIVSISFHKNSDGETIKDVTYMGTDGKLHSREYNDWGIFQGEIIWNLQNDG